ncbi:MAG: (d)CMP kinase [Bacteroidota bacterium]
MKKINIAVDGYAGTGKSTTAKKVAQKLDYLFIDSGAMYRAVSLYLLRNEIDFNTESADLLAALDDIYIDFVMKEGEAHPTVRLNGEEVEGEIRKPEISAIVSPVAVHKNVRRAMVSQQQRMGLEKGVVMDGRDIGTVVFPEAELKIFVSADIKVRAKRRMQELQKRGIETSLDAVIANLKERDYIDSTREEGPLRKAVDAIALDTTHMTINQQVEKVYQLAKDQIFS